jgi:heptosyltransferase II
MELWNIGLDDDFKFFVNQKPETRLVAESLELTYRRDEYGVSLTPQERLESLTLKRKWGDRVIGLNTGCSPVIQAKKLTVETHRELVKKLSHFGRVVLLGGGAEDTKRNAQIAEGLDVIQTSCENGIRNGFVSMNACDIVVSGDSLGMHMAIGLKKWVVAWFGPTCAQEIDLFDRGVKIKTQSACSPCWKRSCSKTVMCYDQVSLDELVSGVKEGLNWLTSSSKQHISEISSSRSL